MSRSEQSKCHDLDTLYSSKTNTSQDAWCSENIVKGRLERRLTRGTATQVQTRRALSAGTKPRKQAKRLVSGGDEWRLSLRDLFAPLDSLQALTPFKVLTLTIVTAGASRCKLQWISAVFSWVISEPSCPAKPSISARKPPPAAVRPDNAGRADNSNR